MIREYGDRVVPWLRRNRLALPLALLAPLGVSLLFLPLRGRVANTDVALVLVVVVVAVAMFASRTAGIVAAISAGIWFDFFFTEPYQRLSVSDSTDVETLVLLLIVGVAVTELAVWGRRQQALASRDAGYLEGLRSAAAVGATGGSASGLIKDVSAQLIEALNLRGCRFQAGVAGLGGPPRLQRDGTIAWRGSARDVEREGLPEEDIELLVESGGRLHGRFMLSPTPHATVPLAQRRLAVTLADQVGAAMH
jgi:hypothetical protein